MFDSRKKMFKIDFAHKKLNEFAYGGRIELRRLEY